MTQLITTEVNTPDLLEGIKAIYDRALSQGVSIGDVIMDTYQLSVDQVATILEDETFNEEIHKVRTVRNAYLKELTTDRLQQQLYDTVNNIQGDPDKLVSFTKALKELSFNKEGEIVVTKRPKSTLGTTRNRAAILEALDKRGPTVELVLEANDSITSFQMLHTLGLDQQDKALQVCVGQHMNALGWVGHKKHKSHNGKRTSMTEYAKPKVIEPLEHEPPAIEIVQ